MLGVLVCSHVCRARVLTVRVFNMLACFMSLRAHMSHMFVVLKYLTCLSAYVLGILVFLICFTYEKLNSKNSSKIFRISLIGSDNITVNNNKNIQNVICAYEMAILSHPKH